MSANVLLWFTHQQEATTQGDDMEAKTTRLNETIRYTVATRRYLDGQYVDSKMTATVTHTIENYWDVWTEEYVALGYHVSIFDSLTNDVSQHVISDASFTKYWVNRAI